MTTATGKLHLERGGAHGHGTLVLLHGLGANASVWKPLLGEIAQHWPGRWLAPDLRGHGLSPFVEPCGFAMHAADVAAVVAAETDGALHVVGHSFGGVVGALLASGLYGPQAASLFAVGVKISWSREEIARSQEAAKKAPRIFATREEAVASYLKGAGLTGLVDPGSAGAVGSVMEVQAGYRVRFHPRLFAGAGPAIAPLFSMVKCPLRLAAGERDPMVTLEQMRPLDAGAFLIADAAHNVHVEAPRALWEAVAAFLAEVSRAGV